MTDLSDHFPVFYVRHLKKKVGNVIPIKIRKINDKSRNEFKNILEQKDWSNILQNFDPEEAFCQFFSFIDETYEKCFPEKIVPSQVMKTSKILKNIIRSTLNLYEKPVMNIIMISFRSLVRTVRKHGKLLMMF